jgi:hypothetical protein
MNQKILFALFVIYAITGSFYHDLWRDETHSMAIAAFSENPIELWKNIRYEGHPIGWYIILFVLFKLGLGINGVYIFHTTLGILAGYLIVFKIEIPFYQKVFLLFGLLLGHEYLFYLRNYIVPIVIFLYLIYREQKELRNIPLYSLLLSLAAQFNIYATIFSICLGIYFFFSTQNKWRYWPYYLLFTASLGFCAITVIPPDDSGLESSIDAKILLILLREYFQGWVLAGDVTTYVTWRSAYPSVFWYILPAITYLLFVWETYKNNKKLALIPLFFFIGIAILFILTHYLVYANRHTGIMLIMMLFILAISRQNKYTSYYFTFILIIETFIGLKTYIRGLVLPESHTVAVHEYLKENHPDAFLTGYEDFIVEGIGFLQGKEIYTYSKKITQPYAVWDKDSDWFNQETTPKVIRQQFDSLKSQNSNALLIYNLQRDTSGIGLTPIKVFHSEILDPARAEYFAIYQ